MLCVRQGRASLRRLLRAGNAGNRPACFRNPLRLLNIAAGAVGCPMLPESAALCQTMPRRNALHRHSQGTPSGRALAALAGDTRFEESAATVATRGTSCQRLPALPTAATAASVANRRHGRQRCQPPPRLPALPTAAAAASVAVGMPDVARKCRVVPDQAAPDKLAWTAASRCQSLANGTVPAIQYATESAEVIMAKDSLIPVERIEKAILLIRGQKVMLDQDLAELYSVPTKVLNQAVKRNLGRFPDDFMFQLTAKEGAALRSQIVTLKRGQHRKYLPYAFTEQGVAMLSSVLNSDRAIEVNIAIMRAFVRLRKILATHKDLARKLDELERKLGDHDAKFHLVLRPFANS
jgi:ORF6N domain